MLRRDYLYWSEYIKCENIFRRRVNVEEWRYDIIELQPYRAIGLKWDGAYTEIPELKKIIHNMQERVNELEHAVNPKLQLGLSYHLRPDGFIHYSVYEVSAEQKIPEGMEEVLVPGMHYFRTHHPKGSDIGRTYMNIYQWMKEKGKYKPYVENGLEYYDDLPIKHEQYPFDRDLSDPHFEILIPVKKEK
ncbi:transcriptional regulator [Bacillus haikouensis]|nr:transcriptional regulator [Bacillus haikouensis]